MAKLRTCIICNKTYEHCRNCNKVDQNETWRNLYDKEECMKVFNVCSAYKNNLISKGDAKIKLKSFDVPTGLKANYQTIVDEIMSEPEPFKKTKNKKKEEEFIDEEIVNTDLDEI